MATNYDPYHLKSPTIYLVKMVVFLVIIGLGIRAQKKKPTTGIQGIIGAYGETLTALDPDGRIRIHGESWSAKSIDGRIEPGARVLAEGLDRLTVLVRKVST